VRGCLRRRHPERAQRVEEDARVLDRIDASLRAIAKKDDFPPR